MNEFDKLFSFDEEYFASHCTAEEINKILVTLPIGYYLHSNTVTVSLSRKEETSFYNPELNTIVISYPAIKDQIDLLYKKNKGMTKEMLEVIKEEQIRGHLFHETSHAMLTPKITYYDAVCWTTKTFKITEVFNIFEDERIETITKNYYLNVDFERDRYLLNGFNSREEAIKAWKPSLPLKTLFYFLVRFRIGPKEWTDKVKKLISKYRDLNSMNHMFESTCKQYAEDIKTLYNNYAAFCKKAVEKEIETEITTIEAELTEEERKLLRAEEEAEPNRNVILKSLNQFASKKNKMAEELIALFRDKEARERRRCSEARSGYAGKVNANNYMGHRREYKWFRRDGGDMNGIAVKPPMIHLMIDCSGSFRGNDEKINEILNAFRIAEKELGKNKFNWDIASVGKGIHIGDKATYIHNSDGSNTLRIDNVRSVMNKISNPNYDEYFLLVVDGDWGVDVRKDDKFFGYEAVRDAEGLITAYKCVWHKWNPMTKCYESIDANSYDQTPLQFFNNKRFIMILDDCHANLASANLLCPMANKTFIHTDYPEVLWDAIIDQLRKVCH